MKRVELINLSTYFCFLIGCLMMIVGVTSGSRAILVPALTLLLLSGIITLISGELTAIRKSLDRLDRR